MINKVQNAINEKFPSIQLESHQDVEWPVFRVPSEDLVNFCSLLKESPELLFDYLACITGVDWNDRFEVVYHIQSLLYNFKIVLKVNVDRRNPSIPSVTGIWAGADFQEREVYDMFGIIIEGHPNLRRILLPEEWEGFPLRKDYVTPN